MLGKLTEEAHKMVGSPTAAHVEHHDLSRDVWSRLEENILRNLIVSFMNPMMHEC